MSRTFFSILSILAAYFLGSIPIGLLLSHWKGVDIRAVGSGNIGATNVFRSISKTLGVATFVGDALKGFVPAFVFPILGNMGSGAFQDSNLGILCGCAAIAGHNWPVFLRFHGGKGIATSAGVLLGIAPTAVGIGLLSWIALFIISRYVSIASMGAAMATAAASWILYLPRGVLLPSVLSVLGGIAIWRHQANIQRLVNGTEHRFQFGNRTKTETADVDQRS
jgi:acyl phosphate:glycerol-3-phosphate acyltransferase